MSSNRPETEDEMPDFPPQRVVIVGPVASGKSRLVRALAIGRVSLILDPYEPSGSNIHHMDRGSELMVITGSTLAEMRQIALRVSEEEGDWFNRFRTSAQVFQLQGLQQPQSALPIPMLLYCNECKARHIDEGEFATKPHSRHACQSCGANFTPCDQPTVGVRFLPGHKNG